MNCAEVRKLAPLYITAELDAARAAEFDAHLKVCPACMQELQRQARLDARVREALVAEGIDAVRMDRLVRKRIAADEKSRSVPARSAGRLAAGAAAIAAVVLLAIVGYRELPRVPRVYADAAFDHQLEIVQQQPRAWLTSAAEIEALAGQQGISPSAVAALSSGAYRLVRGKLCFLDRQIYLHLVLSDGTQEVSVYLRRSDGVPLSGPVREVANGRLVCTSDISREHLASFETPQLVALIVSDQSAEAALKAARFAATVL